MFLVNTAMGSAQVRLVQDNITGSASSEPKPLFIANNMLYFASKVYAANPSYYQYYKTNGTTGAAIPVLDESNSNAILYLSTSSSDINDNFSDPIVVNDVAYFSAVSGNFKGILKTKSNGNVEQVFGLAYAGFYSPFHFNGVILCDAAINTLGYELFKIDLNNNSNSAIIKNINTDAYTYNAMLNFDPGCSAVSDFLEFNGGVIFSATNGSSNGRELWFTDTTGTGTSLFVDVNAGATSSNPEFLNLMSGQVVFVASHPTLGRELFKVNTSGTLTLVKDINPSGDSNITNMTNIGGTLYFSADNGSIGQELWKSNGFGTGTVLLKDINPTGASNPSKFTQVGSTIFFIANDGVNGIELWKTDGTAAGTVMVKNINPSGNSYPDSLTEYNGKLYFSAYGPGSALQELWVSDGTDAGTTLIQINPNPTSAEVSNLIVYNNELYFSANAGGGLGKELYAYMDPALAANDFQLTGNAIKLYPNPTKSHFELATTANVEKVEVYSLQGQLVKTFANQNQYEINDLAKGMYIVKISAQEGVANKTLVIE